MTTMRRTTSRLGPGVVVLEVFENGVPPRFRLRAETEAALVAQTATIETVRPDGARQQFTMKDEGGYLESVQEIPEPHAFVAHVRLGEDNYPVVFDEHEHAHGSAHRDNNMRAALIHVIADAAVSVLVIGCLLLAHLFGWPWMDPLAGIFGACVIASWSYGLIRDTGSILLDMNPDRRMADNLRQTIESEMDIAMSSARYVVVLFGSSGLGPWAQHEISPVIPYRDRKDTAFRLVPVLLPGAKREDVPSTSRRTFSC
jgi:Cation efflux family